MGTIGKLHMQIAVSSDRGSASVVCLPQKVLMKIVHATVHAGGSLQQHEQYFSAIFHHERLSNQANACVRMQVAVSSGGGNISLLSVSEGSLQECSTLQLGEEVACMDMTPIGFNRKSRGSITVGQARPKEQVIHYMRLGASSESCATAGQKCTPPVQGDRMAQS
eukprot:1142975-Pelagomonas_calceolata.AAC.3